MQHMLTNVKHMISNMITDVSLIFAKLLGAFLGAFRRWPRVWHKDIWGS